MNTRRISTVFGALVLALGVMLGMNGAQAGTVTLTNPDGSGPDSALASVAVNSELYDLGATIDASITSVSTGQTVSSDPSTPTGTTSVTANAIAALATGNSNVTTTLNPILPIFTVVTLPIIDGGTPATDGLAVLDYSINAPDITPTPTTITSSVTDSTFSQTLNDFTVGTATLDSNTITAQTTLNTETSYIVGQIPLAYTTSTTTGAAALDYVGPPTYTGQGSIVVFNGQVNAASIGDSGSSATLDDNSITQDIENTGATNEVVTSSPDVSSNIMSANFYGNTADNFIDLQTGLQTAFHGSVSLANGQANLDDGGLDGGNTIVADNSDSAISATISHTGAGTETLTGTLTVDHNTISSLAVGNNALTAGLSSNTGNVITLDDGLDFTGTDTAYSNSMAVESGGLQSTVNADLALLNAQANDDFVGSGNDLNGLGAQTVDASITATVDYLTGGDVGPAWNSITSTSQGAQAYNAILAGGPNTATFNGSASIGSTQINSNTVFVATTDSAEIGAAVAQASGQTVTNSSVDVSHNTTGAYAGAGSVTNELSLEATTLTVGDPTDYAELTAERDYGDGNGISDNASGGAIINNMQNSYADGGAETKALNEDTAIALLAARNTTVDTDTLTVDSNTVEAIARTNNGSSLISLTGTTVSGPAGVLTEQTADNDTQALISDPAFLLWAVNVSGGPGAVTASDLSLSDNLARSLGYGNDGGGSIEVDATTFNLADNNLSPATTITIDNTVSARFDADSANAPDVIGALAVFTDQDVSAIVNGHTDASVTPFLLRVGNDGGGIAGSSAVADANAWVAAARGNVSDNGITVTGVTMAQTGADEYEPAANITNIQTAESGLTIDARASSGLSPTVWVEIAQNIDSSSVSADSNLLTAIADGNYTTNTMEISDTTISDPWFDNILNGATLTANLETDAAFSITNAQVSAQISAGSTISAELDPALTNAAVLVSAGPNDGASISDSSVSASGNTFSSSALANSAANTLSFDPPVTLDASASINNYQVAYSSVTATTLGRDSTGAEIRVSGDVTDSQLNVDNSLYNADATGNTATNTLSATATTITDGSGAGPVTAAESTALIGNSADGTFSLLDTQVFGRPVTATSTGADVIVCDSCSASVSGSALSVSDNTAQAIALGNTSANSIDLSMTNSGNGPPTASMYVGQNNQFDGLDPSLDGSVSASSTYAASSIGQVTDSSVTMDGNSNLALARINDATNSLSASASAVLDTSSSAGGVAKYDTNIATFDLAATADFALTNSQSSLPDTTVSATANTTVSNNDALGSLDTTASSISLSNNTTTAEAEADKASNTLSLNAGSTLAAGGALVNDQEVPTPAAVGAGTTATSVTASATSNITYDTVSSFNASAVSANGNSTKAVAYSNAASNVLNADAGAQYNGAVNAASSSSSGGVLNATAQYAVLNYQTTAGNVTATVGGGVQIGTSGNPLGSAALSTVSGSSASVTGNTFLAQATGNGAANTIGMTALVGGTPTAAIMNSQTNGGNTVSASATSVTMGINAANVSNSSMAVNNNSIAASATGNSAVNVITAH